MQLQCLDSDLLAVASAREADLQPVGSFSDCHSDAIGFRGLSLNIQKASSGDPIEASPKVAETNSCNYCMEKLQCTLAGTP